MLADGFHDVPPGKVAAVVTFLEMTRRPNIKAVGAPEGWELTRAITPDLDWYRTLFRSVGEKWLWFARLRLEDSSLNSILTDPMVHIYTLQNGTVDGALLELDFRTPGACELAYFGLIPSLIGSGAGRYLMNTAIKLAWSEPISRFHMHTCTLDSPQALGFYIRSGFTPIGQKVEIADDPRLTLGFDHRLAAHVPVFRG